jgi:hypothetical protein
VARSEWRWATIFAATFMLATCLPYLFGLALRQPGWYYSGLLTNPDEHNVYLASMRQARDGHLLFLDPFTSEPQRARVLNLFFLALGLFARLTHLPLPVVYHLARVISGSLLLISVYWLAAQMLQGVLARRIALLLTATASGFGWLYHARSGQPHPIDYGPGLVMPEAITFLSLLLNPLFCFSMFLMVATIGLAAQAFTSGSTREAALAGISALVLGNIHSYDLIPVAAVLFAYLLYALISRRAEWRAILLGLLIASIAAPAVIYQYWLLGSGEPGLLAKTLGQWQYSRGPQHLALGLGLPFLLSLLGAVKGLARGAPERSRLLALWLVIGFALVYLPLPFQRKLAEGLHIPACLLAAFALEPLGRVVARRAAIAGAALILLCLPSNALYIRRALGDLVTNNTAYIGNLMPALYLRPDQRQALSWLDDHATSSQMVLSNSFLGSYAPSLAGVKVYLGHWSETLNYAKKVKEFSGFLQAGTADREREAFCRGNGVGFVIRDRSIYDDIFLPTWARAAGGFDPDRSSWLLPVFARDRVTIYRVLKPGELVP